MILELHATPHEVMRAVETFQKFAREKQMPEKDIFGLSLALEECGSNIVNHALKGDPRQTFQVTIEYTGNAMVVELRDNGPEFDPTRAIANPSSNDDQVGGWGIQLVRHYASDIQYRRNAGHNILRLTKILTIPSMPKTSTSTSSKEK